MIRVGLRFRRGDARVLASLERRVRHRELGSELASMFAHAAEAARTGEPLIVQCEDHTEALVLADGYARYGVRRPAVEELSGQRPAK